MKVDSVLWRDLLLAGHRETCTPSGIFWRFSNHITVNETVELQNDAIFKFHFNFSDNFQWET